MRFVVATALMLGGLAACAVPRQPPPPPAPVVAQPPPPPPGPPPAPPMVGPFAGHYVGTAVGRVHRGCPREVHFEMTVANGEVRGMAMVPRGSSDLRGNVGPTGRSVIRMAPQDRFAPRGNLVGRFAHGVFRGRTSAPCVRTLTAAMR